MIFNREYDNALFLVLSGLKENRSLIRQFVSEMPEELYKKICNAMKIYDMYGSTNSNDINIENGAFTLCRISETSKKNPLSTYSYSIDIETGALEIESLFTFEDNLINKLKLVLYPLSYKDYERMEKRENVKLGYVCDTYIEDGVSSSEITSYELVKNPFNNYYVFSHDLTSNTMQCTGVKMNNLPHNIEMQDLKDSVVLKKLLRNKRRSR